MKKLLTVLLTLTTINTIAQTSEGQIMVTENVAYRTDVGKSTVLDLAKPMFGPQQDRPAILIIHGGGWNAGSKNDKVYSELMTYYAKKGYVVANMNYRLTQEAPLPACIEDVRCAIRWMKANSKDLGIDPNRIGTYGHSAGGHLSLMAGVATESKSFKDVSDPWKQYDCSVACAAGGAPPTEIGRAGEWADQISEVNGILERRVRSKEPFTKRPLPRVMITGSPIIFPNIKIPLLIEEMGGVVAADETCMGERGMSDPVVPTDESFDGLIRALAVRAVRPCSCPTFADNKQRIYRMNMPKTLIQRLKIRFSH